MKRPNRILFHKFARNAICDARHGYMILQTTAEACAVVDNTDFFVCESLISLLDESSCWRHIVSVEKREDSCSLLDFE